MEQLARDRFGGIDRLYGAGALARLGGCHVTVVGVGSSRRKAEQAAAEKALEQLK